MSKSFPLMHKFSESSQGSALSKWKTQNPGTNSPSKGNRKISGSRESHRRLAKSVHRCPEECSAERPGWRVSPKDPPEHLQERVSICASAATEGTYLPEGNWKQNQWAKQSRPPSVPKPGGSRSGDQGRGCGAKKENSKLCIPLPLTPPRPNSAPRPSLNPSSFSLLSHRPGLTWEKERSSKLNEMLKVWMRC